jgi:hypothetical protein
VIPWNDSPHDPGGPVTPMQAIVFGAALVIAILLIAIPGCAEFVVEVAGS